MIVKVSFTPKLWKLYPTHFLKKLFLLYYLTSQLLYLWNQPNRRFSPQTLYAKRCETLLGAQLA